MVRFSYCFCRFQYVLCVDFGICRVKAADPEAKEKLQAHSAALLEQIDTLSNIATAFATFAQLPAQQKESLEFEKVVGLAISLFNESYIAYAAPTKPIKVKLDRTQLIRVVTNLLKNAIQSVPEDRTPAIVVSSL